MPLCLVSYVQPLMLLVITLVNVCRLEVLKGAVAELEVLDANSARIATQGCLTRPAHFIAKSNHTPDLTIDICCYREATCTKCLELRWNWIWVHTSLRKPRTYAATRHMILKLFHHS